MDSPRPNLTFAQMGDKVAPQWQPGQSGNPAGRKTAGASIREWYNSMHGWSEDDLKRCMNDKKEGYSKRKVAEAILNMGAVDVADYEDLIEGRKTLAQLKAEGVRTNTIKRVKRKTKTDGGGSEYEIEFRDSVDTVTEAIIGHTDGKAIQRVETTGNLNVNNTPADDVLRAEMDKIRRELMAPVAPVEPLPEQVKESQ